jgi:sugar lactone lactonase YvrE
MVKASTSYTVQTPLVIPHGTLLEGCTYDSRTDALYYIDIPTGSIFTLPNASNVSKQDIIPKSFIVSKSIGVIGLTTDPSKLVCGVEEGISTIDLNNGEIEKIALYPNDNIVNGEQLRSNDGSIGPDGSFWVGTMSENEDKSIGSMWLLKDKNSNLQELWPECNIPNGINWDIQRNIMYWTDSFKKTIYKYNYDSENNQLDINSKTSFFINEENDPDGSCLDSEGNLYIAIWGENKVVRVTPNGDTDKEWIFPSKNVSCCTFGDKDLTTLYVTSASLTNSDEPNPNDLGAAVYKINLSDLGIKGVPKYQFVI